MAAKFETFTGDDKKHYFRYYGQAGRQLLRSEAYVTRQGALGGIQSVKANSKLDSAYRPRTAKDGRFYFNIVARNGEIVATSLYFATSRARSAAIDDVETYAAGAPVEG